MIYFIIAIAIVGIVLTLTAPTTPKDTHTNNETKESLTSAKEEQKKALEAKISQYEQARTSLISEYGEPDNIIKLVEYDLNNEIRAYSKHKKIAILGKVYDFSSILQCHFTDNIRIEKGQTTITSNGTTKTNTGSMVGRAIVGGVLAGGAGAIIGGTSASKGTTTTSVVQQGADITKHDYTVWIYIKDIATPMIQIHVGCDATKVNDIVALMNAIITM